MPCCDDNTRRLVGATAGAVVESGSALCFAFDVLVAVAIGIVSSPYSFLCVPLSLESGDIDKGQRCIERSGDGEHEIGKRSLLFGGLSNTPSSMGLTKKSIVELTVGAEQRKFPMLNITYCP